MAQWLSFIKKIIALHLFHFCCHGGLYIQVRRQNSLFNGLLGWLWTRFVVWEPLHMFLCSCSCKCLSWPAETVSGCDPQGRGRLTPQRIPINGCPHQRAAVRMKDTTGQFGQFTGCPGSWILFPNESRSREQSEDLNPSYIPRKFCGKVLC